MSLFRGPDAKPVFERRTTDGRVMAVYADGRSEGFPEEYSITINRVPSYGHECIQERERHEAAN
jgi:hypothetical protein